VTANWIRRFLDSQKWLLSRLGTGAVQTGRVLFWWFRY